MIEEAFFTGFWIVVAAVAAVLLAYGPAVLIHEYVLDYKEGRSAEANLVAFISLGLWAAIVFMALCVAIGLAVNLVIA